MGRPDERLDVQPIDVQDDHQPLYRKQVVFRPLWTGRAAKPLEHNRRHAQQPEGPRARHDPLPPERPEHEQVPHGDQKRNHRTHRIAEAGKRTSHRLADLSGNHLSSGGPFCGKATSGKVKMKATQNTQYHQEFLAPADPYHGFRDHRMHGEDPGPKRRCRRIPPSSVHNLLLIRTAKQSQNEPKQEPYVGQMEQNVGQLEASRMFSPDLVVDREAQRSHRIVAGYTPRTWIGQIEDLPDVFDAQTMDEGVSEHLLADVQADELITPDPVKDRGDQASQKPHRRQYWPPDRCGLLHCGVPFRRLTNAKTDTGASVVGKSPEFCRLPIILETIASVWKILRTAV